MTPCPGLPRWAGTRKVKPIWILLEQETVRGTGISWAVWKSVPRSRQITTALHHSVFYRPDALPAAQQRQSIEGTSNPNATDYHVRGTTPGCYQRYTQKDAPTRRNRQGRMRLVMWSEMVLKYRGRSRHRQNYPCVSSPDTERAPSTPICTSYRHIRAQIILSYDQLWAALLIGRTPSRNVEHYHMFTASRSPGMTL